MVYFCKQPIIILAGPTASGKSALALDIAQTIPAVIINCDSKQLYRDIPIITAQPTMAEQQRVPHQLYGCLPASEHCSVAQWVALAKRAIDDTHAQGKIPLLVGGTGMYIKGLMEGFAPVPDIDPAVREKIRQQLEAIGHEAFHRRLAERDPQMAKKLQPGDSQRVIRAMEVLEQTGISLAIWQQKPSITHYRGDQFRTFFLSPDREVTYQRCTIRFQAMLQAGVIEEVSALDAQTLDETLPAMKAHGVPEIRAYLHGRMTLADATAQAIKNTRHYIKRQFTWFRHQMPEALQLSGENPEQTIVEMIARRG